MSKKIIKEEIFSDYEDLSVSADGKRKKVDKSSLRSKVCAIENSANCGGTSPKMNCQDSKNSKHPIVLLQRMEVPQLKEEEEATTSKMNSTLKEAVELEESFKQDILNKYLDKTVETPDVETSGPNAEFEHLDSSVVRPGAGSQKKIGDVCFKCEECSFGTNYRKGLMSHYRLHYEEFSNRTFDCNFCVYAATEKSILFKHLFWVHLKDNYFKCHLCSYSSDRNSNLRKHLHTHKSKMLWKCDECSFYTFYKSGLTNHKKCHFKMKSWLSSPAENNMKSCQYTKSPKKKNIFQGNRCSFNIESDSTLKGHTDSLITKNTLQCDKCSVATHHQDHQDAFECHSASHSCKIYQCDKCSFCTIRQAQFEEHILLHANVLKCDYCSFTTPLISYLEEHLRSHSDKALLNNTYCVYSTISKSQFDQHSLTHKFKVLLECEHCPYTTKSRFDFEQHLKVHLEVKLIECQTCPFASTNADEFHQHSCGDFADDMFFLDAQDGMPTIDQSNSKNATFEQEMLQQEDSFYPETKQREFKMCSSYSESDVLSFNANTFNCDNCSFSTKKKSEFELHSLSHVKEEVIQCDACPFSTTKQEELEVHSLTHSKEDIFQCQTCTFSTKDEKEFRFHLFSHSPKQIYQCGTCSFSTKKKKLFELHLLSHVKEEVVHCDVCPFSTTTLEELEAHSLTHLNKSYLEECSSHRMDKQEIQSHSRKEILQCKICSFSTWKKSIFRLHSLYHVKDENYQYEEHFYSTKDQKKFKTRMLTHSKKEKFQGKPFSPASSGEENFREHLGNTSEMRFQCENCSFSTKKKSVFQIHSLSHVKREKLHCGNSVSPENETSFHSPSLSEKLDFRKDWDFTNPKKQNNEMEVSVDDYQEPKYDCVEGHERNGNFFSEFSLPI